MQLLEKILDWIKLKNHQEGNGKVIFPNVTCLNIKLKPVCQLPNKMCFKHWFHNESGAWPTLTASKTTINPLHLEVVIWLIIRHQLKPISRGWGKNPFPYFVERNSYTDEAFIQIY